MASLATSVKLNDQLKCRVQRLAEIKDRSVHWLMCEAIRDYVRREEARESFIQEAMDSWVDYQETGLHLNLQEVNDWLASWGTDAEKEAPVCHG